MYYHIIITRKNEKKAIYELDYTDKEIIFEHIESYLQKKDFHFDGHYLSFSEIDSLKIFETKEMSQYLCEIQNKKNISSNIFYFVLQSDIVQSSNYGTDITRQIINEVKKIVQEAKMQHTLGINPLPTTNQIENKNKIFIVHGHDKAIKSETARFLEKLNLEPIILSEQANGGNTIIEKLEEHTNVGFAIVLYTACDFGAVKADKENLKPRARQNVVLEHGYLMGKLGRKKVCALFEEGVETPSDVSGIVYILIDNHDAWKINVAKELKQAGYDIDMNLVTI